MYSIPLSYTPIDTEGLTRILGAYKDQPIMDLVADFEAEVKRYTGSQYVLAVNSGTSAIHLALKAAGVGPGDEVLVSTFTYVATVNPIIYLGAKPVFIDSESTTWNMDPALLSKAIERHPGKMPKAILIVHAYGMPACMDELMSCARHYNIPVIEDAAEAIGSKWHQKMVGTIGQSGVLSFNNNKLITTYGGGALLTNDAQVFQKALFVSTQAREDKPFYEHNQIGYNYRMNPLAAAHGLLAMKTILRKIDSRRSIFDRYRSGALSLRKIQVMPEIPNYFSNRWLSTVLLPDDRVAEAQNAFKSAGIEVRPFWKPMHEQPVFQQFTSFSSGVSSSLFRRGLTLPSSDSLSFNEQENVMSVFEKLGYATP